MLNPKASLPTEVGAVGGLLFLGAIIGVIIIPPFSDRLHKRKIVFLVPLIFSVPAMIGLTFFQSPILVMISSFLLGFFLLGGSPVAIQYATEICYPAPEGTSMGIFHPHRSNLRGRYFPDGLVVFQEQFVHPLDGGDHHYAGARYS